MRRRDIASRAGRNLRQSKARTLLTALAISVGAFTLTLSLAAGQGSRDYATRLIQSNIDPQSLFIVRDSSFFSSNGGATSALTKKSVATVSARNGSDVKALTSEDINKITNIDGVTDVSPIFQLTVDSLDFAVDPGTLYTGGATVYDPNVVSESLAGTLPDRGVDLAPNEAVVPDSYATSLGVSADELVGKRVIMTIVQPNQSASQEDIANAFVTGGADSVSELVKGQTKEVALTIRAVIKQSSTSFTDSSSMQIARQTALDAYNFTTKGTDGYGKYIAVTAKAKEGVKPEVVKASIESSGYAAKTAQDLQSLLFTIVNILQGIVGGFGVLALIASVFGIINTQYISVLERTSQIGLMKALGMSGRVTAQLFRYEAAWIGFIGGVLGSVSALGVGLVANPIIEKALNLGEGRYLLVFVWWQIVLLIGALVFIAVFAGWLPARKAARLDPIEALRVE